MKRIEFTHVNALITLADFSILKEKTTGHVHGKDFITYSLKVKRVKFTPESVSRVITCSRSKFHLK